MSAYWEMIITWAAVTGNGGTIAGRHKDLKVLATYVTIHGMGPLEWLFPNMQALLNYFYVSLWIFLKIRYS